MGDTVYEFDSLPVPGLRPGTTALLTSRSAERARRFALRLFVEAGSQAVVLVTTANRASDIVTECRAAGLTVNRDRLVIVDCTGKRAWFSSARVERVSDPTNVGGIGFQFSKVSQEFVVDDVGPVGAAVFSLSDLLSGPDLQTVSRFVNTTTGRIQRTRGLGLLVLDPEEHDQRVIDTLAEFCDGRISLRYADGESRLRLSGFTDRPGEWLPYELPTE